MNRSQLARIQPSEVFQSIRQGNSISPEVLVHAILTHQEALAHCESRRIGGRIDEGPDEDLVLGLDHAKSQQTLGGAAKAFAPLLSSEEPQCRAAAIEILAKAGLADEYHEEMMRAAIEDCMRTEVMQAYFSFGIPRMSQAIHDSHLPYFLEFCRKRYSYRFDESIDAAAPARVFKIDATELAKKILNLDLETNRANGDDPTKVSYAGVKMFSAIIGENAEAVLALLNDKIYHWQMLGVLATGEYRGDANAFGQQREAIVEKLISISRSSRNLGVVLCGIGFLGHALPQAEKAIRETIWSTSLSEDDAHNAITSISSLGQEGAELLLEEILEADKELESGFAHTARYYTLVRGLTCFNAITGAMLGNLLDTCPRVGMLLLAQFLKEAYVSGRSLRRSGMSSNDVFDPERWIPDAALMEKVVPLLASAQQQTKEAAVAALERASYLSIPALLLAPEAHAGDCVPFIRKISFHYRARETAHQLLEAAVDADAVKKIVAAGPHLLQVRNLPALIKELCNQVYYKPEYAHQAVEILKAFGPQAYPSLIELGAAQESVADAVSEYFQSVRLASQSYLVDAAAGKHKSDSPALRAYAATVLQEFDK